MPPVQLLWFCAAGATRVLSLDEALSTAEAHQPDLRVERANVEVIRARANEARAPLLPQVTGTASFEETTSNFAPRPGALPSNVTQTRPNSFALSSLYSVGVTATQLLFDFGQTWDRWRAAKSLATAEMNTERETRLQLRLNVRAAYYSARAQMSLVEVARQTLSNEERHLAQVQGFVEVGTHPQIDLVQEKAARANAKLSLIQAENAYATSKAQLNQTLGVEASTDYDVQDTPSLPLSGEGRETDELMAEALSSRPEFAALESQVKAQELAISATRGAYFPSLSLQVGASDVGQQPNKLAWNVYGQVGLVWPIFSGLLTRSQVEEGDAVLVQLQAKRDAARLAVRLEVEQARLAVRAGGAELETAAEVLENAEERLRLAEGRYQTGVGSIIELGDAQVARTSAAAQKVRAEDDLATARAQLTKALARD